MIELLLHSKMHLIVSLGVMLILLIHITVSNVHYVMPEEDENTANTDAHTLQHYVDNPVKYFTSNTRLQFLAGTHYFYDNLVVKNVTNFSLVGSHMAIIYSQFAAILMDHADTVTISNIFVKPKNSVELPLLALTNCSNIIIEDSVFTCPSKDCTLMIADALKVVNLHNVISDYLILWHNQSVGHCNIIVSNYTGQNTDNKTFAIRIELNQHSYKINILLYKIKVNNLNKAISIRSKTCKGNNFIKFEKITFTGAMSRNNNIIYVWLENCGKKYGKHLANIIHFDKCYFTEIKTTALLIYISAQQKDFLSRYSVISFINCIFYKTQSFGILAAFARSYSEAALWKPRLIINVQNTTLSKLTILGTVMHIQDADLILLGPVIFTKIESYSLIHVRNTKVYLQNYIEVSLNKLSLCLGTRYVILRENSKLNISTNTFNTIFLVVDKMSLYREGYEYAWCVFQYINSHKNINKNLTFKNYSILLENNSGKYIFDGRFATSHCDWIDDSAFMQLNSQDVNKEIIQLVNNSFVQDRIMNNYICFCKNYQQYNCIVSMK